MRLVSCALLSMLVVIQAACTTIHVHSPDGVVIDRHFGVLALAPRSGSSSMVIEISGTGVIPLPDGAAFGHAWERIAILDVADPCGIVIWFPEDATPAFVDETLSRMSMDNSTCVIGKE
jgi:hypothetical protein